MVGRLYSSGGSERLSYFMMIRKSTINLNYCNTGKKNKVLDFLDRYTEAVNQYTDILWEIKRFTGSFVGREVLDQVDVPLSFSAKQGAACSALHIVKSQRKRKKKTKPTFSGKSFELDQRFVVIQEGKNSFDIWITIKGMGRKSGERNSVKIPTKKHKHFNKFIQEGWKLKKSIRIRRKGDQLFGDLFFEKVAPAQKEEGDIIGLDCGYKKLAVLSTGQMVGEELESKCEKISRKKQGSKAFHRALKERDEYINKEVKKIKLSDLKAIVVENLKNVKKNSKGKVARRFMNKLQRWTYPYFLRRLEQACEVVGVQCHKVNPAYTSQRCWQCGSIHKENRNGEIFKCMECGYTSGADFNASLNILNRFLTGITSQACLT